MIWLAKLFKTTVIAMSIAIAAMALPALILPVAGQPQSAIVIFAGAVDPGNLPQEVTILNWDRHIARLDGVDAVTARRLYAEGAVLVMPFRKSGCISYRKA
jgi:hypothetical protein